MDIRGFWQRQGELGAVLASFRQVVSVLWLFSFVVNLLLLVPSVYMLQVYDRVLSSRNEVTLYMLTLIMVALYLLEAAIEFVRARVMVRAGATLDLKLNARVFQASFERQLRGGGAEASQAFTDLATVRQFLTGQGLFAFFDAPWTPIYIVVIFLLHPWLGVFALFAAAILLALAYASEQATRALLSEAARTAASANTYAARNLRNAEVIEAMGMLHRLRQRWMARQNRFLALQAEASDRAASVNAATRFFRLTLQSGILGLGALFVIDNQMTAGGMIAASILLGRALSPVELAIANWRGFVAARGAYARLAKLLQAHPPLQRTLALPRPKGEIAVENLVLGAPGSPHPILKDLGFRAPAGSLIAVVGPSASGKSTLARALVGVWAPTSGAVRLDGAEVHKWNRDEFGAWAGYLPQDIELFDGTVAENIARFGDIDSASIVEAARRAGVHEMILQLPRGYETPIGEGGAVLSGGQRQRIALARALYGDPALLVLDEPNSSLDDAGNNALLAALRQLRDEGRTTFVITHRLNILNIADAVVVLGGGALQAFGPRDAVLKTLLPKGQASIVSPEDKLASGNRAA